MTEGKISTQKMAVEESGRATATEVRAAKTGPSADTMAEQVAAMQDTMKQLVTIVSAQQETLTTQQNTFREMQESGLRVSDAMAVMDTRLTLEAHMGRNGWECELEGSWTMGHINQLRLVLRGEIQQMATRMKQQQNRDAVAHRSGAPLPKFGD